MNKERQITDDLLVPIIIVVFAVFAWLIYAYQNRAWFAVFQLVLAWMANPIINYTSVQIQGVPIAFLATIEVLVLGAASALLLLNNEKDRTLKIITALGLGFGLTGLMTIILGIFGNLFVLPLNALLLVTSLALLSIIVYRKKTMQKLELKKSLLSLSSIKEFSLPANFKFWFPACIAIAIIFFFCFYHALLTVIVHWDAVVYHATMANIMYNNHAIPVIAGPSIGIEMSANFPPLFPALGAFYYIQIGTIEDFFLRAIPPVMGFLSVVATYKIGEVLAGKKFGLISALFLSITPLFFRYSIYTTSYSTLTFFCTISVLFLLLAITKGDIKYWICCGFFLGFALLTSYMTLYLAPFFVAALAAYLAHRKNSFKINVKKLFILFFAVLAIGGVWYVRNAVMVGNPIYPNAYTILGGINIDPLIEQTTFDSIKTNAVTNMFGGQTALLEKTLTVLTYRTYFPSISLLTILGLVLIPTLNNKKFWLIAIWPLTLCAFILSGITWGFPHHMVFAMPGFAIISALPIIKALDICKKYDIDSSKNTLLKIKNRLPLIRKSNLIRVGIVIMLFAAFLFPSLTLAMSGKIVADDINDDVPSDLWFLENPNSNTWTVINKLYPQTRLWEFMNANLSVGEKAATIENNFYYVKNCSSDYFFYLDGWEARQLYNITDPAMMVKFLRDKNVTYVVEDRWSRLTGHYDLLPLAKFLGSPYFPTIIDYSTNFTVYNIGPIASPITNGSKQLISIIKDGWTEIQSINGVKSQSVIAGSDTTRLFVPASNLNMLTITYLDTGKDILSINLRDPISKLWIHDFAIIQKNNTCEWRSFKFLTPPCEKRFLELGLHSYTENFTISKIDAAPYQSGGTVSLRVLSNMTLANQMVSPKLILYLPWLNENEKILFRANSHGKALGMEVFEGVIQPWETSNLQTYHNLAARVPPSMVTGEINPALILETKKSDVYTLVIELREGSKGANVDLQILRGRVT